MNLEGKRPLPSCSQTSSKKRKKESCSQTNLGAKRIMNVKHTFTQMYTRHPLGVRLIGGIYALHK